MKTKLFFKSDLTRLRGLVVILLVMFAYTQAWAADETLTLSPSDWSTGSYGNGTKTKSTTASTSIGITYNQVYQNSSCIQMAKSTGYIYSTTRPSTNIKIKSIKVDFAINTVSAYGSKDGTSWASITITDNTAADVSSCNYCYFKIAADNGSYAQLNSIVVVYTEAPARTVTFNAESGMCATSSLTESSGMAGVVLPAASPSSECSKEGWTFVGWATSACDETTTMPTLYFSGATYYPGTNVELHAVYGKVGASTTTTYTMMSGGVVNSNWSTGGRVTPNATYPASGSESKVSIQLMAANESDPCGYIQTKTLFANVTAVSAVATCNNANKDTLSYSSDGVTWTKWSNYMSVSKNTSAYSTPSFTMTSFPSGYLFLRITCNVTSLFIYSISITHTPITYYSNPDCIYDYFVDNMHGNETTTQQGTYSMPAALSDADKGDDYCAEKHYHFVGWLSEAYVNADGTLKDGYASYLYAPGHSGHTANNTTYYAIWVTD